MEQLEPPRHVASSQLLVLFCSLPIAITSPATVSAIHGKGVCVRCPMMLTASIVSGKFEFISYSVIEAVVTIWFMVALANLISHTI